MLVGWLVVCLILSVGLPTGHGRLNSPMHGKPKLASSPTCPCGQEDQTSEHVLQRCPLHKVLRDVCPVSTPLTTKLYGCKQELEKTTSFISRAAVIVHPANAKKKKKKKIKKHHHLDDQTLRLQAGAGEDDFIHLQSGPARVACERQEGELYLDSLASAHSALWSVLC